MEKIKKVTVRVNGNEEVFYEVKGEKIKTEWKVLRKIFKDQGELYEQIYKIDRETAKLAGWHPEDSNFNTECEGWQKFIKDQGKICKEEIIEQFSVEEFIRNYVGF